MPNYTVRSPFGFAIAEQLGASEPEFSCSDDAWFFMAIVEARKGVGRTRPNPPVGAVIVKDGQVVGQGFTAPAGGHHAEINALREAGGSAKGATLYVTLEPCSHQGRTPPCMHAIIKAGIKRVVIGVKDPNPLVNGQGMAAMRAAGIEVELRPEDHLSLLARALILPFQKSIERQLPWVICKVATSLDGRVAQREGARTSISGQVAWQLVHRVRNLVDAVAVGSNTVLVDNPQLTVRGLRGRDVKNPIRLVLDGSLHTDARSAVYQANHDDAYVIHTALAPQERIDAFDEAGVNRIVVASEHGHISLTDVLWALPQIGIASVLFECGSKLLTEFLRAGLFDELWWMVSPAVFGAGGPNAVVGDLPPELTQRIDWAGPVNLECDSLFLGRRKD